MVDMPNQTPTSQSNWQRNDNVVGLHNNERIFFDSMLFWNNRDSNEMLVNHHHHDVPTVWISLTLSRHSSLSFIASDRSSGIHPVSSQSCCMYVIAGRPAFAQLYEGVQWRTLMMSSSLLLQQYPACLVWLTLIIFVMGGRWPYNCCFVGCCLQGYDYGQLLTQKC